MKKGNNKSESEILRQKAEEALNTSALLSVRKTHQPVNPSETDTLTLIHELEVHQIQLEMQNEELIRARSIALEASEKLNELYDFSPSGYFSISKGGKIIELNLSGSQMLGKERSHLINSSFGLFISSDSKHIFNRFLGKAFNSKAKESCELTLSTNDNRSMYVYITGIVTGNSEQCLLSVVDITERKLAEENLLNSEKKYRNLVENAIIGIYTTNLQGKFLFANYAICKMLEYNSIDELLNANVISVYKNKEEREKFIEILKKEKQIFNHELELITTTGKTIDVLINSFISGEVITGMIMDISGRKLAEKEILKLSEELDQRVKQRTAELEEANKELETFSYSISHDLKAPLRHIGGFIGLFLDHKSTQLTREELGYLEVISSSASEMGRLIDAILSFSRLNRSELRTTTIHSSGLIRQVIKFFEPEIQNRKITFNVESMPDVKGDEELIRQVWTNLISNAIKYTGKKPEAIIDIGSISTDNETTFFIKDNGAGFNMKYADKLFRVFQRLHKTRDFEGVGIGLANVNRIVRRHGGQCRAEGEPDKGATFYFTLPK
ncbi:MAG: ATP-binding protein [Bacteroidetes bacterium]|nr:ATP-binding protein [Bacteroidota bacterium]